MVSIKTARHICRLAEGSCSEAFCAVLEVGEVIHLVTEGLLHGTILKTGGVAEGVAAEAAEPSSPRGERVGTVRSIVT